MVQVQTATMIMYSNKINFPSKHSTQWQDFVRQALEKKPHMRPTATAMLEHPWIRCPHTFALSLSPLKGSNGNCYLSVIFLNDSQSSILSGLRILAGHIKYC